MRDSKYLKRPIKYAIIFSLVTFWLYLYGPYKYPDINRGILTVFILGTNLCMYWGFSFGTKYALSCNHKSLIKKNVSGNTSTFLGYSYSQILNFLFWIALIVCVPKFILYSGAYSMSLSTLLSKVSDFFSSAQDIYVARQTLKNATGIWKYINYFIVLTGPLYWAYTPLALYSWGELKTGKRIGSIVIWLFYLMQYLITGTNVGFFDLFLTVLVVTFIKSWLKNKSKRVRRKKRPILLFIIIAILLFSVFNIVMQSRIGDQYLKGGSLGSNRYYFNTDSIIWKIVPPTFVSMISYLTRYLANSYNAVAYALSMPFKCTYGLGHSWFVLDNLGSSLSEALWARTYNMQIEAAYGFGHYGNWHTAYLWFANDVSFLGLPILFFFLYYYFGRAWKRYVEERDLFCFLRFMIFVKMSYFISANNQIFQNSDTLFAFWILAVLTMLGKKCTMERQLHENV